MPSTSPSVRIRVVWNQLSRAAWDQAHARARGSYQQDWAYGEAMASVGRGVRVLRAAASLPDGEVLALAQFVARPFAMIGRVALCTHGPAWVGDVNAATRAATYRALKSAPPLGWPRLMVFTPDESSGPDAGLRGLSRVMTSDATALIDLTQDEPALRAAMETRWRNRLSRAERSGLACLRAGVKPGQYQWLLEREQEQRVRRGYRALPVELTRAWQAAKAAGGDASGGLVMMRADSGRDAVAAMLFLVHGRRATYHIGWAGEAGRAANAHNLLLWRAMLDLKSRGVELLDMGGVNTQSGAGIARFKLGAGGRVVQRAGAFV